MPDVAVVNGTILGDPANQERDPIGYYVNGTANLANWLSNHGTEGSRSLPRGHGRAQLFLARCR